MKKFRSVDKKAKIHRLAEAIRLAMRAYENGKQDTSLKLIELVASQLERADERRALHRLVVEEAKRSEIWPQYYAILFRPKQAHHQPRKASQNADSDCGSSSDQASLDPKVDTMHRPTPFWRIFKRRQGASVPRQTPRRRRSFS